MHIYLRNVIEETKAYAQKGTVPATTDAPVVVPLSINNPAATLTSTKATIGIKMKLKGAGGLSSISIAYLNSTADAAPVLTIIDDRSAAAKTLKIKDIPGLKDDTLVFVVSADIVKMVADQPQNKDVNTTYLSASDAEPFTSWVQDAASNLVLRQKEREIAAAEKKEAAAGKKRERAEDETTTAAVAPTTTKPTGSTTPAVDSDFARAMQGVNAAEDGSSMDDDEEWDDEDGFDEEGDGDWEDEEITDGSDAAENSEELQLLMDTLDSFGLTIKGVKMLDQLLNLPNINELWSKFQSDPTAVMVEVQQNSPELFQLVTENHEEFLKIMEMRRKMREDGLRLDDMMPEGEVNQTPHVPGDIVPDAEVSERLRELVNIYKEEGIPSADGMTVTDMEGNVIHSALDDDMFAGMGGALGQLTALDGASAQAPLEPLLPEDEENITSLQGLGNFTREQCEKALRRCNKDIQRAAAFLFENYTD